MTEARCKYRYPNVGIQNCLQTEQRKVLSGSDHHSAAGTKLLSLLDNLGGNCCFANLGRLKLFSLGV